MQNPADVSIDQERHMHSILDEGLFELRKSTERSLSLRGLRRGEATSTTSPQNLRQVAQMLNFENQSQMSQMSTYQNDQSQYVPLRNNNNQQFNISNFSAQKYQQNDNFHNQSTSNNLLLSSINSQSHQYQQQINNHNQRFGANSQTIQSFMPQQQHSNSKNQSLKRLIEEVKLSSDSITTRLREQPSLSNLNTKRNPLQESSTASSNMHIDLVQLQQRIMGLEKKIQEDNETMRRQKDTKQERLKGIIKQTTQMNSNERVSFSFNEDKPINIKVKNGDYLRDRESLENEDENSQILVKQYESRDYVNSEEEPKKTKVIRVKRQPKHSKQHSSQSSQDDSALSKQEQELYQISKKLRRNTRSKSSNNRNTSRPRSQQSKVSRSTHSNKSYVSKKSQNIESDESLKRATSQLKKLKTQLNKINTSKVATKKQNHMKQQNGQSRSSSQKSNKSNVSSSLRRRDKSDENKSVGRNNSRSLSLKEMQKKVMQERSTSKSRVKQNQSLFSAMNHSNNISMTQLHSSVYLNEKENFHKEQKFKRLEAQNKKLQQELDQSRQELREERKNNQELILLVEKISKKAQTKENDSEKFKEMESELLVMIESFTKSEQIRREQKACIQRLKKEFDKEKSKNSKNQVLEEDSSSQLDELPVKQSKNRGNKQNNKIDDKENQELIMHRKSKKQLK
eukprot:403348441